MNWNLNRAHETLPLRHRKQCAIPGDGAYFFVIAAARGMAGPRRVFSTLQMVSVALAREGESPSRPGRKKGADTGSLILFWR